MPLTLPKEPTREDTLFGYLQRAVPKLYVGEQHRNAWISLLTDTRSSTSFQVSSEIHAFLCWSPTYSFGTTRCRYPKSVSR